MFDVLARLRSLRLVTLLSVAALTASCDQIGSPSLDDAEQEEGEVAVVSAGLAAGRHVVIELSADLASGSSIAVGDTTLSMGRNEMSVSDMQHLFGILCAESYATHANQAGTKVGTQTTLRGQCGGHQEQASMRVQNGGVVTPASWLYQGTDAVAFASLCSAHLALRAAGAVQPLYANQAASGALTLSEEDPGQDKRYIVVPPPNAASSAAFALFAVERFRRAVLMYSFAFDDCSSKLSLPYGPEQVSLATVLSANLSDAMSSMMEAAKEAEKFVSASAAAKSATAPDLSTASIRAWRERRDSRLEALWVRLSC